MANEHFGKRGELNLLLNRSFLRRFTEFCCYGFPELAAGEGGTPNLGGPPVFLCTQSLFRLIPQHDALFARIARRVRNARFRLPEDKSTLSADRFRRRLGGAFAAHGLDAG